MRSIFLLCVCKLRDPIDTISYQSNTSVSTINSPSQEHTTSYQIQHNRFRFPKFAVIDPHLRNTLSAINKNVSETRIVHLSMVWLAVSLYNGWIIEPLKWSVHWIILCSLVFWDLNSNWFLLINACYFCCVYCFCGRGMVSRSLLTSEPTVRRMFWFEAYRM